MPQPNYYRPVKISRKFGAIFDHKGDEVNERERGLDGECPDTGRGHEWLMLPHEGGQKQYLLCLECPETSHL